MCECLCVVGGGLGLGGGLGGGRKGGGVMSAHDETHLGMNASPFISLFSSVHSQRLMERSDKRGVQCVCVGGGLSGVVWNEGGE